MTDRKPTTRLQQLIQRTAPVLAVMHAPSATHARLMEMTGAEAAFVGTSGVAGAYTGLASARIS
jgi:2-methylisocitrate lyase-like PEP mutase family enzyme